MLQMLFGIIILSGKFTLFRKVSKSTSFTTFFAKTLIKHKKYNVFAPAGRPAGSPARQLAGQPASQP